MNPRISVVMSVYNSEDTLREALESVLNQTYKDFEFLIVDDCSRDGSRTILNEYQTKDARIRIISNEQNLGLTKSLNKALREAKGEYIARMDADDLSYPLRFEKQLAFLDAHPDVGFIGTQADIINEQGEKIGELNYPSDHASLKRDLIKYNPFIHASLMMRKSVYDKAGGYDESWRTAQDYELYFRLIKISHAANIPERLVAHRFSAGSITAKKNRSQVASVIRAKVKALKRGDYPLTASVFLLKPFLAYVLPVSWKRSIKRMLGSH